MTNPDRFSSASETQGGVAAVVAHVRENGADSSPDAILVGSRAGVVEWANRSWTRITGFSVSETIEKPISHFLELAGIELELVDFVGRHFIEGRSCMIEFPFETPEGREIRIHLRVRPIPDRSGELSTFLATARVLDEPRDSETPPASDESGNAPNAPCTDPSQTASTPMKRRHGDPTDETEGSIDLSATVRRACARLAGQLGARIAIDLCLEDGLPHVEARADLLERLVSRLFERASHAIGSDWGTLSLLTGRTTGGRSHVSKVHPVTARLPESAARPSLFLEVHDSGRALSRDALDEIGQGDNDDSLGASALGEASRLAARLGTSLHLQSSPGCGNQVLVLFPIEKTIPEGTSGHV